MFKHITDNIRHGDTNAKDDVSALKELYVGWLESEENLIKSPSLCSVGRILMLISCLENARCIPFHDIEQLEEVDTIIISVLQLKKPSPRMHWSLDQSSVLFSCSVMSDCLWLMDCSMPGFPVHHQLPEFAQAHVHRVNNASNHLIFCCLLLLPSIFPSIRVLTRAPHWQMSESGIQRLFS